MMSGWMQQPLFIIVRPVPGPSTAMVFLLALVSLSLGLFPAASGVKKSHSRLRFEMLPALREN
jgi:hypothetical protein